MRRRLFLCGLLLPGIGMSHADAPVSPQSLPAGISGWSSGWLVGTTLNLLSETDVLTLRFMEGGWVAVTTGKKDGPLAAPLLPWRIEGSRLLMGEAARPEDSIEFIAISGNRIVTRSAGKNSIFEVSQ